MNLEFDMMFCEKHGAKIREIFPAGQLLGISGMLNAAKKNDLIQARSQMQSMEKVLHSLKPLCCFLGDKVTAEVVTAVLAGRIYQ